MMRTVERASLEGVTHFRMVHDDFATHACDAPKLAQVLRESYYSLFADSDHLNTLRDALQSALPEGVQLPPAPAQGSMNLKELENSTYFFA